MRILHAARNIANQPGYIVNALRRMGHEAEVWEFGETQFRFPNDRQIDLTDGDPRVFWNAFLDAIDRFDVLHFHFGRTLFPNQWGGVPPFWDLPIYRILGKKVFFTFHGSDCRIRRIHEAINPWSYYRFSEFPSDDDRTEKVIEVIRTYANRTFVVSIDYLPFVPDATVLPRVIDLDEWPEQTPWQRDVPVVLHLPSRRGTKGSSFVIEGMRTLAAEGVPVQFRLVEGVPHEEARRAIQAADIVIDSVITGDYELVSMEAMASSRVAVANIQEAAARAFPDAPVYNVDPDTFVDRMRSLLADAGLRRNLAARGRPYIAATHDAPVIASRLLTYYEEASPTVGVRAFPDWLSLEGSRKIERLEKRVTLLELELARGQYRENGLRARLGLEPLVLAGIPPDRTWKEALPAPIRLFLRRARARVRDVRRGR